MPLENDPAETTPDRRVFYGDIRNRFGRLLGDLQIKAPPPPLEAYLREIVDATLAQKKAAGAVAAKFEAAYLRSLDFAVVPAAKAARIYAAHIAGGKSASAADNKPLQDFLYRHLAREAGRLALPVHIHVGSGIGGYFDQRGANPLPHESLFGDPALAATKFVMLHAPWPSPC